MRRLDSYGADVAPVVGWISPTGVFRPCGYAEHDVAARDILVELGLETSLGPPPGALVMTPPRFGRSPSVSTPPEEYDFDEERRARVAGLGGRHEARLSALAWAKVMYVPSTRDYLAAIPERPTKALLDTLYGLALKAKELGDEKAFSDLSRWWKEAANHE